MNLTGIRVTATGKFSVIYYKDGKGDTTMLALEVMKQCRPAALPRLENVSVSIQNISLQSLKNMLHGSGIRHQNCIKFTIFNP